MTTDPDAVIKNVAAKNGYGLHKDDALMLLVTIVNQLTEDQQAGVAAALEKYRDVHEGLAHKWRQDAAATANKILNTALDAGRAAMAKGMNEGAAQVVAMVADATKTALAEQQAAILEMVMEMKRFTIWVMAATGVALAGAVLLAVWS